MANRPSENARKTVEELKQAHPQPRLLESQTVILTDFSRMALKNDGELFHALPDAVLVNGVPVMLQAAWFRHGSGQDAFAAILINQKDLTVEILHNGLSEWPEWLTDGLRVMTKGIVSAENTAPRHNPILH